MLSGVPVVNLLLREENRINQSVRQYYAAVIRHAPQTGICCVWRIRAEFRGVNASSRNPENPTLDLRHSLYRRA